MKFLDLLTQIINLSQNANLTKSMKRLETLYESGADVDFIDISAIACFYIDKDNVQKQEWEKMIFSVLEKYHPDIELAALLRKQHKHIY